MNNQDFYELYDNVVVNVVSRLLQEVSLEDKKEYGLFLSDLYGSSGIKASIKRNFYSNVYRINKQGFFNGNEDFLKCVKVASLCDALLRNKVVCFTVKEKMPTEILIINYKIALEVAIKGLAYELYRREELIYPTMDFKDLLLLSIIVNDSTQAHIFDVLTFASVLLLLYEYNK